MLESKVELVQPTKNVILAMLTPRLFIQLTAFIAFETGRKLNSAFFPPAINFCHSKKKVFPSLLSNNSHTMNRFIIFMRINEDDDGIDYECYVKNLLRFFSKNMSRERIDKRFKKFCYFGSLKIVII